MSRITTKNRVWGLKPLTVAVALAAAMPAHAVRFDIGDVQGQFDSQLSVGSAWSTAERDEDLIWVNNGGRANAANSDDGRLNYEKGDVISTIFKGSHDLSLQYGDTGVFLRGKYWYDFEMKDGSQLLYDIDDTGRRDLAQASGAALLDAFIYHNYSVGSMPGSVRVGRQVVSWGESTFIQNSVNSINPVDVAAFRRPGAEIKEGLIPVNMLYLSQSLTENLGMELFYQLEWDPLVLDNCGTFFSFTDAVAKGCDYTVVDGTQLSGGPMVYVPRLENREPSDSGQFGAAFRWFVPALNDTEFGVYAMNFHSRAPIYSNVAGTGAPVGAAYNPRRDVVEVPLDAAYFVEYPEDIRLYGVSFQTNLGGMSVSGEVSYRPNQPLQISTNDTVAAALGGGANPFTPVNLSGYYPGLVPGVPAPAGYEIRGYKRMPVTQAQVTAIRFMDNVLGADRLTLVGEAGYNHIGGLKSGPGELRFGRDSIFGSGELAVPGLCETVVNTAQPQYCSDEGFYTQHSWGYRLVAALDYSGFAGVALTPNLAFSHDVEGYGPNFNEGAKAASVGLNALYNNQYNASLSYTNYFGGDFNTLTDRDFVAVSVGVNF